MKSYTLTVKDGRRIITKMAGIDLPDAIKYLVLCEGKLSQAANGQASIELDGAVNQEATQPLIDVVADAPSAEPSRKPAKA